MVGQSKTASLRDDTARLFKDGNFSQQATSKYLPIGGRDEGGLIDTPSVQPLLGLPCLRPWMPPCQARLFRQDSQKVFHHLDMIPTDSRPALSSRDLLEYPNRMPPEPADVKSEFCSGVRYMRYLKAHGFQSFFPCGSTEYHPEAGPEH